MPQSLSNILVHLVFCTKERAPILAPILEDAWRDKAAVIQYIAGQREHHRKATFQDEYRRLLEKYGIEYDERYVWD